MRESLYRYSDDELSLRVFNTEYLYNQRHEKSFIRNLRQQFQATNKQWATLKADLISDKEEIEKFNLKGE